MAVETYPAIAQWVRDCGWIEMDDREGGGFVARALDYTGVVFEGTEADTLTEAVRALEQTIAEQHDQRSNHQMMESWGGEGDLKLGLTVVRSCDTIREARSPTQANPEPPANADAGPGSPEEGIRMRAYLLAESAGFPDGRDHEFWFRAEREVRWAGGQHPEATGSH